MNKGKPFLIVLCLFLVHSSVDATLDIRTSPINPIKKVSPIETNIKELFAREFNILTFALGIYQLDTKGGLTKEYIKEALADNVRTCKDSLEVDFDLDNIDFRRKGFTRYYPFSVNGQDFIIRVFDLREEHYLPDFDIFYEGAFEESNIGFQIIPGIKTILKTTKAEKLHLYDPAIYSTQP